MRKLIVGIGFVIASLAAQPLLAQSGAAVVATGPGVGGVAHTVTATGTITAIDATTREVTILGEGGRTLVVEAGDDVTNFAKLKVGDTVDMELVRALALELHKGSTAPVSRTDEAAQAKAEPGKAPAGAVGRRVVVMAEVTAVDAATRIVTLKGPNQSVDLEVTDPAQFALVAVGDRVEATYVEAVALKVTPKAAAKE